MRKIQLAMILAFFVPNIVLAGPDLFETKPKQMPVPEMIKPDIGVTPYDKKSKDFEVIPEQRTGPTPVRIPDVVSEGIICTDSGVSLRVLFDGPVSKNYSGLVKYPGMSTLPYPQRPWQEGADALSWSPSRDGKALHATLDQKMMDYLKRGVSEGYEQIGSLHYTINMDGKMVDRLLSLKGMLVPRC